MRSRLSHVFRGLGLGLILALALPLAACTPPTVGTGTTTATGTVSSDASKAAEAAAAKMDVILGSTTSTQDSGLFDVLIPAFQQANPQFLMKVIAVGSGEALKLGEKKDVDVLLVHSPSAETSFVAAGFGTDRKPVMYNDFVIVGPASDPAKISGLKTGADAFKKIAAAKAGFASRGDASGTYTKEVSLWTAAGVAPKGQSWYKSTGQGMGETLQYANEKRIYTLVDRGTWLASKAKSPDLKILLEGDPKLFNPYHVILIPGAKNTAGAKAFADWLVSAAGQKVIGDFGVAKYGQQLFVPNAGAAN
jgi:tungstate transport system substrate-binding protein